MPITTSAGGTLITGPEIALAAHLSNWYAGKVEIRTGMSAGTRRWQWMAAQCASTKRTHVGIFVDYTIWLAGFGIEPEGTAQAAERMNQTNRRALEIGLRRARRTAAKRKAEAGK